MSEVSFSDTDKKVVGTEDVLRRGLKNPRRKRREDEVPAGVSEQGPVK